MGVSPLSNSPIFPLPSYSSLSHRTIDHVFFSSSLRRISISGSVSSNRSDVITGSSVQASDKEIPNVITGSSIQVSDKEIPIEMRFPRFPIVMDSVQIREVLPHRYPFLLVDRIIEHEPGVHIVGIKNLSINDDFFRGHFPHRPIMPGVLMVETMAQVGGLMLLKPKMKQRFFFAGIDKLRFRKPVVAGDTLVVKVTLLKVQRRYGMFNVEGKAYVGGQIVCEAELTLSTGAVTAD